jgi:hypothetical protein
MKPRLLLNGEFDIPQMRVDWSAVGQDYLNRVRILPILPCLYANPVERIAVRHDVCSIKVLFEVCELFVSEHGLIEETECTYSYYDEKYNSPKAIACFAHFVFLCLLFLVEKVYFFYCEC